MKWIDCTDAVEVSGGSSHKQRDHVTNRQWTSLRPSYDRGQREDIVGHSINEKFVNLEQLFFLSSSLLLLLLLLFLFLVTDWIMAQDGP